MTIESAKATNFRARLKSWLRLVRTSWLFWIALASYCLVTIAVVVYINRTPVFSSSMSIVLPGSESASSFNIDDVGQVSQSTRTPFGSAAFSPLVNYKEIIRGREVTSETTKQLDINAEQIQGIRVEMIERTSILHVYLDAESPELSQEIAWSVYNEFQNVLDRLRIDEVERRDRSVINAMNHYRDRVTKTRNAVVEFQQRALLVSKDQVVQLMNSISALDEKIVGLRSTERRIELFVRQMGLDLGVSPSLAGKAFLLQSDAEFRGYLKELDDSAMLRAEYSSRWGEHHPKVVAQTLRYEGARGALMKRSESLVGSQVASTLYSTDLQSSPDRAQLFAKLVDQFAQLQGTKAELVELQRSELEMNDKLRSLSRESAELERLERDHDLAEAVYTSAAAKLEAGKSDIFASYPAVQLLSTPSFPEKPKNPNPKIAAVIGGLGFIFITFGVIALWHRKYFIELLLKNG